jgi:hypothetical protein
LLVSVTPYRRPGPAAAWSSTWVITSPTPTPLVRPATTAMPAPAPTSVRVPNERLSAGSDMSVSSQRTGAAVEHDPKHAPAAAEIRTGSLHGSIRTARPPSSVSCWPMRRARPGHPSTPHGLPSYD